MTKTRIYAVQILTLIVVGVLIYQSWFPANKKQASLPENTMLSQPIELVVLEKQAKIIIGALEYLKANSSAQSEVIKAQVQATFRQALSSNTASQTNNWALIASELILYDYLSLKDEARAKLHDLEQIPQADPRLSSLHGSILDTFRIKLAKEGNKELSVLPKRVRETLASESHMLGWFGSLLRVGLDIEAPAEKEAFYQDAKSTSIKMGGLLFVGSLVMLTSALLTLAFAYKYIRKKLVFTFKQSSIETAYLLEIFALYLFAMFGTPYLFKYIAPYLPNIDPLQMNIIAILALLVFILWPLLFRINAQNLFQSLGMSGLGLGNVVKGFLFGPVMYIGSLCTFFLFLIIYSSVLMYLQIDISQGTHPVIPILLSESNRETFWMIVFLAVVVAPIVEEIMFRGAFYSWLRERFSAKSSAIISGFIFASVHPQGLVGVVPLMAIGCILALVREWKHSIIPAIATHACFNAGTLLFVVLFFGKQAVG